MYSSRLQASKILAFQGVPVLALEPVDFEDEVCPKVLIEFLDAHTQISVSVFGGVASTRGGAWYLACSKIVALPFIFSPTPLHQSSLVIVVFLTSSLNLLLIHYHKVEGFLENGHIVVPQKMYELPKKMECNTCKVLTFTFNFHSPASFLLLRLFATRLRRCVSTARQASCYSKEENRRSCRRETGVCSS